MGSVSLLLSILVLKQNLMASIKIVMNGDVQTSTVTVSSDCDTVCRFYEV